jgi:hypothetical protein
MANRIAVECDGDFWHGPERHELDVARQRVLERCGWAFCRIRGSAFAFDPEHALESLWLTLDQHGVRPGGAGVQEEKPSATTFTEVEERPVARGVLLPRAPSPRVFSNSTNSTDSTEDDVPHTPGVNEVSGHDGRTYREWRAMPLPDPTGAGTAALTPGLFSIIEQEGPMTVQRACRLFVKAAGGQRVSKLDRKSLYRAIRRCAQDGSLILRNESESRDFDDWIVRTKDSTVVLIRQRGPRDFSEVPPSEIAALMEELSSGNAALQVSSALAREVLNFYDTRRMTTNIEERLRWIEARRRSLLSTADDTPGAGPITIH